MDEDLQGAAIELGMERVFVAVPEPIGGSAGIAVGVNVEET